MINISKDISFYYRKNIPSEHGWACGEGASDDDGHLGSVVWGYGKRNFRCGLDYANASVHEKQGRHPGTVRGEPDPRDSQHRDQRATCLRKFSVLH
jgi:hypothetical protein